MILKPWLSETDILITHPSKIVVVAVCAAKHRGALAENFNQPRDKE
jgi:hypothetical protein